MELPFTDHGRKSQTTCRAPSRRSTDLWGASSAMNRWISRSWRRGTYKFAIFHTPMGYRIAQFYADPKFLALTTDGFPPPLPRGHAFAGMTGHGSTDQ